MDEPSEYRQGRGNRMWDVDGKECVDCAHAELFEDAASGFICST